MRMATTASKMSSYVAVYSTIVNITKCLKTVLPNIQFKEVSPGNLFQVYIISVYAWVAIKLMQLKVAQPTVKLHPTACCINMYLVSWHTNCTKKFDAAFATVLHPVFRCVWWQTHRLYVMMWFLCAKYRVNVFIDCLYDSTGIKKLKPGPCDMPCSSIHSL
jgi:Na+/H+-dicarboxylate symporter